MSEKPLPASIRPDARPFSREALKALAVDEIDRILDDHRGQMGCIEWTANDLRAMTWWLSLDHAEREAWQGWVRRDIQRAEIGILLKHPRLS
jgi:hypothetical protein